MRSAVRRAADAEGYRAPRAEVIPFVRRWERDLGAARVLRLVAAQRGVPPLLLLHPSRCTADIAEARQLAMYLMHVVLARSYLEVGDFFGRDRTTVAYACAHIEDMRDDPDFEAEVLQMETALAADPEENRSASRG